MTTGNFDKFKFDIVCDVTNPWHAKLTEKLTKINDCCVKATSIEQCKNGVQDQCPGAPEDTFTITEK